MGSIAVPRPGAVATRIARLLRPAAAELGAWVSTEAAVQLDGHPLLRPAVVVVQGEPPYDGVVSKRPLLVVELDPAKMARWLSTRLPAIWGPWGDDAVEICRGARCIRLRGEHLVAAAHPTLTLPVVELLRPAGVDNVVHLPR